MRCLVDNNLVACTHRYAHVSMLLGLTVKTRFVKRTSLLASSQPRATSALLQDLAIAGYTLRTPRERAPSETHRVFQPE